MLKFYQRLASNRLKNSDSGVVLIIVLWVVSLLSFMSVSFARGIHMEVMLTKHAVARVKARTLAENGIIHAINMLRIDLNDEASSTEDTLFACGVVPPENESLEELFSEEMEGGMFKIITDDQYGFIDEERKINLNALTLSNANVLLELIKLLDDGYSDDELNGFIYALIDWKDTDSNPSHGEWGSEESGQSLYNVKNKPLDSLSELKFVAKYDDNIFKLIRPYVTIFPKTGTLKVNYNTASREVLTAIARTHAEQRTNTDDSDADSLVEEIIRFRSGDDGQEGTFDDKTVDFNQLNLGQSEKIIFLSMKSYQLSKSQYFRINSEGISDGVSAKNRVSAVVDRETLAILGWHSE